MVKNLSAVQETWIGSPGGGHGNPLQYSCLENPQGQRSLAGPWGREELDITEQLITAQHNPVISFTPQKDPGHQAWLCLFSQMKKTEGQGGKVASRPRASQC